MSYKSQTYCNNNWARGPPVGRRWHDEILDPEQPAGVTYFCHECGVRVAVRLTKHYPGEPDHYFFAPDSNGRHPILCLPCKQEYYQPGNVPRVRELESGVELVAEAAARDAAHELRKEQTFNINRR